MFIQNNYLVGFSFLTAPIQLPEQNQISTVCELGIEEPHPSKDPRSFQYYISPYVFPHAGIIAAYHSGKDYFCYFYNPQTDGWTKALHSFDLWINLQWDYNYAAPIRFERLEEYKNGCREKLKTQS